jgi:hypothetical protein
VKLKIDDDLKLPTQRSEGAMWLTVPPTALTMR